MAIESKRIAKNTAILYLRMLVMMAVSLYTSRILLSALGISDYGIYNVVGGIVVMVGFLRGTMSTASSRFITVALSRNVMKEMRTTFETILFINILLSLLVVFFCETIGLWFLMNRMVIPEGRMTAAFWVFQFSVVSVAMAIVTVPYNATIIAHEKMGAFAYISLFDAFAKLLIVYLIIASSYDRLIFYGALMLLVHIINIVVYVIYCRRNFSETNTHIGYDKVILKEMFQFISWASYGSFVSVGFTQGLNIILNLFFGPVVNAARGIAVQVQGAVDQFTTNFQTAINPQLIKSTATRDFESAQKLLIASSKYSFFLLSILGIPIIIEAPFILGLWLKDVPDYSISFCRIILTISIFGSLANALRIVNQAEGNIKKFQLCECTLLLLIMPLSYFVLKIWQVPILVFVVHLSIEMIAQIIRVFLVVPKIKMTFNTYVRKVYVPILPIFFISIIVAYGIHVALPDKSFITFCVTLVVSELLLLTGIYYWGMDKSERKNMVGYVSRMYNRHNSKRTIT